MRAAASSMARGSPSRRAQISATAGALALVTWKSGLTACARSMKSATASYCESVARSGRCLGSGSASAGTGNSCSARTCSASRLVTSTLSRGQALSRSATCSGCARHLLEVVQQQQHLLLAERRLSVGPAATDLLLPEDRASGRWPGSTRSGSLSGARDTNQVPSAKCSLTSAATCKPRRVLPTPPGPVSVTRRTSWRRSAAGRRPPPSRAQ